MADEKTQMEGKPVKVHIRSGGSGTLKITIPKALIEYKDFKNGDLVRILIDKI